MSPSSDTHSHTHTRWTDITLGRGRTCLDLESTTKLCWRLKNVGISLWTLLFFFFIPPPLGCSGDDSGRRAVRLWHSTRMSLSSSTLSRPSGPGRAQRTTEILVGWLHFKGKGQQGKDCCNTEAFLRETFINRSRHLPFIFLPCVCACSQRVPLCPLEVGKPLLSFAPKSGEPQDRQ